MRILMVCTSHFFASSNTDKLYWENCAFLYIIRWKLVIKCPVGKIADVFLEASG